MPDYDVGAVSLSVPPASAVIQPYRPAVLVKNFGVHDALAVGSLRIYGPAGLLIFTSELYSGVIGPGETKAAQTVDYWTPPALGRYMFIAHVSCINDQDPSNDNLPPVFVQIIPGPPAPPTPVQAHAAQHEEGGGDEIIIDGLHGRAADAQDARAHKTSHQAGGDDVINVTGLPGRLAEPQGLAEHHESHENHGGDELTVDGLVGVLYNLQKPQIHANEAHSPNYAKTGHGNEEHVPDFVIAIKTPEQTGQERTVEADVEKVLESQSIAADLLHFHDAIEIEVAGHIYMNNPDRNMQWSIYLKDEFGTLVSFYDIPLFPTIDGFFNVRAVLYLTNNKELAPSGVGYWGVDRDDLTIHTPVNPGTLVTFDNTVSHDLDLNAYFDSRHNDDAMTIFTSAIRFLHGA